MAHRALQQCLFDVEWGNLDYLIVDLPPGTGDIHLTLAQQVPLTGAVIVSTPQDVGLRISMKTLRMFQQTRVPILGIVENMSYYICPHCNSRDHIFGEGGARRAAAELEIPFLGEVPLDLAIRQQSDARLTHRCRATGVRKRKDTAGDQPESGGSGQHPGIFHVAGT